MNRLAELLSSRVKAEILRLLFGVAQRELHIREIGRQAGLADATVRQELKRLGGLGLVEVRRDGNRAYYRANAHHPLFPDLRNLVLKTAGVVDVLRQALDDPGIRLAFVFGSVAEGAEGPGSDIDLMVIGSIGLRRLGELLSGVSGKLGREVNAHALTPAELARRRKARDHFVSTVIGGRRLMVIGDEDELEGLGG